MWNLPNKGDTDEFGDEEDGEDEEEALERIEKQVDAWWEEFKNSTSFQQLADELQSEAMFVIQNFAEFAYDYEGLKPEQWDPAIIEDYCLDYAPRKVSAEEGFFRAIEPVLSTFLLFLQPLGIVADPPRMIRSLRECSPKMIPLSQNPANWGFAKSLAMQAIADGRNLSEPGVMQMYAMMHNMNQLQIAQERHRQASRPTTSRKIGRNEPCPCGSGLKYKKCCGRRASPSPPR
jgi:hypothetical protein